MSVLRPEGYPIVFTTFAGGVPKPLSEEASEAATNELFTGLEQAMATVGTRRFGSQKPAMVPSPLSQELVEIPA